MKLAVNYSDMLISLLEKNPRLSVDYLKVPTRPFPDCWDQFDYGLRNLARRSRANQFQLLPHIAQVGVLALGHPQPEQRFDPPTLERILSLTNPPYLSTHLEARVEYFPEVKEYQHQNHPRVRRILTEHFGRVIREFTEYLQIPVVVENFPYYILVAAFSVWLGSGIYYGNL